MGVLGGKRQDAAYDPINKEFVLLPSTSGFLGYKRDLTENLFVNISGGVVTINNRDFQSDEEYSHGYNTLINFFWEPVEGARLGFEYANGQRFNKGNDQGMANKVSVLLYYDF